MTGAPPGTRAVLRNFVGWADNQNGFNALANAAGEPEDSVVGDLQEEGLPRLAELTEELDEAAREASEVLAMDAVAALSTDELETASRSDQVWRWLLDWDERHAEIDAVFRPGEALRDRQVCAEGLTTVRRHREALLAASPSSELGREAALYFEDAEDRLERCQRIDDPQILTKVLYSEGLKARLDQGGKVTKMAQREVDAMDNLLLAKLRSAARN